MRTPMGDLIKFLAYLWPPCVCTCLHCTTSALHYIGFNVVKESKTALSLSEWCCMSFVEGGFLFLLHIMLYL